MDESCSQDLFVRLDCPQTCDRTPGCQSLLADILELMFEQEPAQRRCSFPGCNRAHRARGLCRSHYGQQSRGEALRPLGPRNREEVGCDFDGCGNAAVNKGPCQAHANQRKKGQPLRPLRPFYGRKGPCRFDGCSKPRVAGGFCAGNAAQYYGGRPLAPLWKPKVGCDFPGCTKRHFALGYCQGHWRQLREKRPLAPLREMKGWRIDRGYVFLFEPTQPNAHRDGYVAEHTKVMAAKLGRPLERFEAVGATRIWGRPPGKLEHMFGDGGRGGTVVAEPTCSIEGCGRKYVARGYCGMHYKRWSTTGQLGPADLINKPAKGLICQVDGCCTDVTAKGFCGMHYWRWRANGHPGAAATVTRKPRGVPCEVADCRRVAAGDGLCRMHYERRRRRGKLGSSNALRAVRGAGSRTRHGYRVITVNGRQVLEHRYVMEQHLGRPLRKGETVHHRDGNRSRNTIENLELWTRAQPSGQRAVDLLAWAEEIVARYGPERHLLSSRNRRGVEYADGYGEPIPRR